MSYTVLARRYRSQTFDQLVGQQAVTQTLLAAVRLNRVAHAYLFTGTRGVGKTSTARLLADALANPSGDATIHDAILSGRDTDVIEIDAASNNSVENARELIANAGYRPLRGHKKVYIVDEVHMLSNSAFNALLKIMEEPPPHVVFILCTTDTHKVPATIQSRCQRYDFRNISAADIAAQLRAVVDGEQRQADDDVLHMVARLANGSMRDALSLMERLLATGQARLTGEALEQLLGLPERALIGALIDAAAEANTAAALGAAHQLLSTGTSVEQVLTALADRFRDLMVIHACGADTELVDLNDDARKAADRQAQRFDPAGLVHNIALCDAVARSSRTSTFPRALFDALVVRLCMAEKLADVTAIVSGTARAAPTLPPATSAPSRPAPASPPALAAGSAPAKKR